MPRGSSFASRSPAATFHFIRRGTRISLPRRINKSLFEFPSRGGTERKERERENEALEKLKFGSRWKRRRQLVEFTRMKFPTFRTFQLFERASFVLGLARLVRAVTSHCVEYKSKGFDYNVRRNRRNATTTVLEITPLSGKRERGIARGWSRFYLNRYCCIRLGSFVLSSSLSLLAPLLPTLVFSSLFTP